MSRVALALLIPLTLLFSLSAPALAQTAASQEEKIRLNMNNAEIQTVIQWVAEQTQKNFIVDPRVKGRISVLSSQPMTLEQAYQVFLTALDVYGFAAIESGNNVKVIPNAQARSAGLPVIESFGDIADDNAELVLHVIKVNNISATELVTILRPLVPQTGHLAAFPGNNSVIIADRASNIQRMLQLIQHVDNSGEINVEVIKLEHATAQEVVEVLAPLVKGKGGNAQVGPGSISLASDPRSNSILMAGDPDRRGQLVDLVRELDRPLQGNGNTQVIYLNYIDASEVVPILQGMSGSLKTDNQNVKVSSSEVNIQASETTNALIVTAPPSILETIMGVIEQLDIRRSQVLIEAIIAEVSDRFTESAEIYWGTTDMQNGGVGSISLPGGLSELNFTTPGLNFGFFRNGNLRALLNFIASDTTNNVLSTPSLVTLDNEEAEILVGSNVPFVTGNQTSSASSTSNPFQTIQREDVGITLKVTPKVNKANTITLEIEQEVEAVSQTEVEGAQDLVTDKRSIKTQVLVGDGEILVLGGLIEDKITISQSKVPLLGDIPLLGLLFRSSSETLSKQNLMVFLKATIFDDQQSAESETENRYKNIREQQKLHRKTREKNIDPALPEYPGNKTSASEQAIPEENTEQTDAQVEKN